MLFSTAAKLHTKAAEAKELLAAKRGASDDADSPSASSAELATSSSSVQAPSSSVIPGRVPLAVLFASTARSQAKLAKEKAKAAAEELGTIEETKAASGASAGPPKKAETKPLGQKKVPLAALFKMTHKLSAAAADAREAVAERKSAALAASAEGISSSSASLPALPSSQEVPSQASPRASVLASSAAAPGRVSVAQLFAASKARTVQLEGEAE